MRWLSFARVLVAASCALAACGSTVVQPDLALIPPGCRLPSKCFQADCPCNRASNDGGITGDCIACDPTLMTSQQCDVCSPDLGLACVEPLQLCVGKGKICPGVGARCIDPRTITDAGVCAASGGDPPTMIGVVDPDGGPETSVPRCAYADDECCPGSDADGGLDLSVPDLGNPPDLLATD
jgi:hypothetical protein